MGSRGVDLERAMPYIEATPADLLAVCRLGAEVNEMHREAVPGVFAAAEDGGADAAHWGAALNAPTATTFLALNGEVAVGFLTVSVHLEGAPILQPMRFGKVGTVCVSANYQGRGIGRALMDLAERWALARGAQELRLNVWAFNEGARHLYEELGYALRSHQMAKSLQAPAQGLA